MGMKKNEAIKFKRSIPVVLGIAMFALLAVSVFSIFWLQRLNTANNVQTTLNSVHRLFHGLLYQDAMFMRNLIALHEDDKTLRDAFTAGDRGKLIEYATPLLEDFALMYDITHFYFYTPEKICFLRVHNPIQYGDLGKKFTLDEAAREGEASYGMEFGRFGTFTLRVVEPWRINGQLVGYIELGKEIEAIVPELKKIMDVELTFVIEKDMLTREKWIAGDSWSEKGQAHAMEERAAVWDLYPNHVIAGTTMAKMPALVNEDLQSDHREHESAMLHVDVDGVDYRGGFTPLLEVSGRDVGDLLILQDYSEVDMIQRRITAIIVIVFTIIALLLFVLLYYLVHQFEKQLLRVDGPKTVSREETVPPPPVAT